jgi:N utilization substance protein B
MLYQWDLTREPMDRVSAAFWQVRSTTDQTRAIAERLARGARDHVEELDAAIAKASAHWRFERIAALDRNVLRLGAYELLKEPATPAAVVLDEAIELAKRFGEADSAAFVNGVLDAVRRAARVPEAVAGSGQEPA